MHDVAPAERVRVAAQARAHALADAHLRSVGAERLDRAAGCGAKKIRFRLGALVRVNEQPHRSAVAVRLAVQRDDVRDDVGLVGLDLHLEDSARVIRCRTGA